MFPLKALDSVTAAGSGASYDLDMTAADFTLWVANSDPSSSATWRFEGSPDGTLWKALAADGTVGGSSVVSVSVGPGQGGNIIWCRFVRVSVVSVNSGSPVITAWVTGPGKDE